MIVIPFISVYDLYSGNVTELKEIKNRFRDIYIDNSFTKNYWDLQKEEMISDQSVVELFNKFPIERDTILKLLNGLDKNGKWSDIDYNNKTRSGWEVKQHVERILRMAMYYYSNKDNSNIKDLKKGLFCSLDYWLENNPKCPNWWYNEIGIPKLLGTIGILLENDLNRNRKEKLINILKQSKISRTGQNRIWLSGNVLMRGLLSDDIDLVKEAYDAIIKEIKVSSKEGIQFDNSFHQHGPQQQFGNYGLSYIYDISFYYRLFEDTSYEFPKEKKSIILNLLNDGYRWVIWNGKLDINSLNRQLFHNASIHKGIMLGLAALNLNEKRFVYDNFYNTNSFTGHKHFYKSDYTIHRNKNWMASLKMSSSRVIGAEQINEDNLKGYYSGDGALYVYRNTDEYENVFPLWDWRKIPGITSFDTNLPIDWKKRGYSSNLNSFVGGVTDGVTGMSCMDFNRDKLYAKKIWIMTNDFIFCMGCAIRTDSCLNTYTTIDQRFKRGEIISLDNVNKSMFRTDSEKMNSLRVWHDSIGYIVYGTPVSNIEVKSELKTGKWSDVMGSYSSDMSARGEIFTLGINHRDDNDTYRYIIIPNKDKDYIKRFDIDCINIIQNNDDLQVVLIDGVYYIAAYKKIKVDIAQNVVIDIQTPGLYMVRLTGGNIEYIYSDPLNEEKKGCLNLLN